LANKREIPLPSSSRALDSSALDPLLRAHDALQLHPHPHQQRS
jgi:hypothetical protein